MIFSIDITEAFGAIDFDNAGGIKSYIRILPTENFLIAFASTYQILYLT